MKAENDQSPLALRQVWDWKTAVWDDLRDVPFVKAAATVARRAHENARDLGFQTVTSPAKARYVAEERAEYASKAKDDAGKA
jgi:hypothetical protein